MAESLFHFPGNIPGKITKWKVKRGTRVYSGSLLALYETDESKTVLKLKANEVGTVLELLVEPDQEVLPGDPVIKIEGCKHPTVMKDMCAECGADLRRDEVGKDKENTSASVAMVASIPELIVSEQEALEIGKTDEDRLLKNRKLVLLVDLDQTLIHTTNDNIPANMKDVYHFQLWHGRNLLWYHTKLRPGTEKFLENISKQYELHICTFGVRMYAHTIAGFIDPKGNLFSHRILSRDECFSPNSKTANLKALFPRGDSMVAIIDDREDVWNYLPNVIHVKPYLFFVGTADINAPPSLKKDEPAGEKRKSRIVKVPKKKQHDQPLASPTQPKSESSNGSDKQETMDVDITEDTESSKSESDSVNSQKVAELETEMIKKVTENKDSMQPTDKETHKEKTAKETGKEILKDNTDTEQCTEVKCDDSDEPNEDNQEGEDAEEANKTNEDPNTKVVKEDKEEPTDTKNDDDSEYEELIEWEDEDDYLLYLEDILHRVHTAFYELYDQMKTTEKQTVPNVKKIIPYVRRKVLKGTNIVFSGVFPLRTPPEKSRAYIIAQALGANVQTQFVARQEDNKTLATSHVVAAKLGTVKVNTALKQKGVHVVTPEWLWTCNDRWERVDERLFYLNDKNSRFNIRDSPDVSKMKRRKRKRTGKQTSQNDSKKVKSDSTEKDESTKEEDMQNNEEMEDQEDVREEEDDGDDNGKDDNMKDEEKPSTSTGGAKRRVERQFSETLNPLISFSKDDIDNMDKEVEDLLDEPDSDDSETKEQETLRKKILGKRVEESSSEDSLSGDLPRGWNLKRKHPRKKLPSDEGEDEEDEMEGIIDGAPDQPHRVFKHSDQSSSSGNSDFNESVGSVDEEMAEAIEREFLSY